ncbi:hypothetical protein B9Z55_017875 [Caenorhabditis nigoni]|uniref:G-protein coupled receptors family 1 profile domain-containing protein n=1 Tax=Caenorhabditis nigoni TaxID=1611254 RepID=A0A2G5TBG5_9PELO|nr:hypothetical protein B9Z55_017875 [Caenorhabditis nigoni]
MYVNIPHYYIPKLCGILAFIFNPLFVYLLLTDKKLQLGAYRHLLISFSFFNMLCSLYDTLVPMCVHEYRYAFVVFVSDGPFVHFSDLGQLALSVRCGFITVTYAILHAHFIFRYFVLYKNTLLQEWFMPYGLVATFVYCICHMALWTWVCECFFYGDFERKSYVHDSFEDLYHEDSLNMTMVIALYWEGSNDALVRSWIGVVIVTASTVYSMSLYFVLGHKIMKKLKVQSSLSEKTINLQRQLFNALTVQTVIPICVSLMPCLAVWFGPVFLLDFRWIYLSALSCLSVDFYITFLFQPQPLHPLPAGFCTGLLCTFFTAATLMTVALALIAFQLSAIFLCFLKKLIAFREMKRVETNANFPRVLFGVFLIICCLALTCMFFAELDEDEQLELIRTADYLSRSLSSVNQKKQKLALISLVIQLIVLATAIIPVGLLAIFLLIEFEYAQTATRIELMVYCFHSTANAIALILTTPAFRRFTFFWTVM